MEPHQQGRLHRYFTIKPGTLYEGEGLRMSIMVTRKGRGGQRRDVATAVLDIMRERYEMAERVFYHHKKAAASAMLAKLVELAGPGGKPRDDALIYPAPWTREKKVVASPHMTHPSDSELPYSAPGTGEEKVVVPPHTTHLSDSELIDYLGGVEVAPEHASLQKYLHDALRFRRQDFYRTLLVIDLDLVDGGRFSLDYVVQELRGPVEKPSAEGRLKLEAELAVAAKADNGEVIIYCPSAKMQSKEVDARLEIREESVLPLRIQRGSFVYNEDVEVLQHYYRELWRAYIFVSPALFRNAARCQVLIDSFCEHYGIPVAVAYGKVRGHNFIVGPGVTINDVLRAIEKFLAGLPLRVVPPSTVARLLGNAGQDTEFLALVRGGGDVRQRLSLLLENTALLAFADAQKARLSKAQDDEIRTYAEELLAGSKPLRIAAQKDRSGEPWPDFDSYLNDLVNSIVVLPDPSKEQTNE